MTTLILGCLFVGTILGARYTLVRLSRSDEQ